MIYVATVCKKNDKMISGRPEGDWASFIDTNKSKAIERAMVAKQKWESDSRWHVEYRILVGTLKEEVALPTHYTLKRLGGQREN